MSGGFYAFEGLVVLYEISMVNQLAELWHRLSITGGIQYVQTSVDGLNWVYAAFAFS